MTGDRASPTAGRQRWLGLAGTVLLAVGAALSGARPGPAPTSRAEALWGATVAFRVGLAAYLAGLVLLGLAWWRLGALLRGPHPPRHRWVLTTGALWALPLLVAPPLGSRDIYAYACQGAVWNDGHDPYTVGAAAGGCPWVTAVPEVWRETPTPYGPLALLVSAGAVALARALVTGTDPQLVAALAGLRVAAVAGTLLVAAFAPRLARACGVPEGAAAWLGLVTPLVAVHAVAGAHNDALVAGLVVAGLALAAARRYPSSGVARPPWPAVLAGAALGAAVAVKVTAVVALPFAVILAAGRAAPRLAARDGPGTGRGVERAAHDDRRAEGGDPPAGAVRRYRAAVLLAVAAVATFGGLTIGTGLGVGWVTALAGTGSLEQWTSPPSGVGMAVGYVLWGLGWPEAFDPAVALARLLGLGALAAVGVALLARAVRRAGETRIVVGAAGTAMAATVLLGPVVYPWYALAPLAVLAASVVDPQVQRRLAAATLVLTALVLPTGLGLAVLTRLPGAFAVAVGVGLLSWAWLRRRRADRVPLDRSPVPPEPAR